MNDSDRQLPELVLQFTSGEGVVRVPLDDRPVSVGRHSDNRIALEDALASRFHCVFWAKSGKAWVRDLNSSNGTSVNGAKIVTAEISPRDVINVGDTRIELIAADGQGAWNATSWSSVVVAPPNARPAIDENQAAKTVHFEPRVDDAEDIDDHPSLEDIAALEHDSIEMLDSSDVVELGPQDVIEDDENPLASAGAFWSRSLGERASDDAGPIPLEGADVYATEYNVDTEAILGELAASLPDHLFAESDIALLNARGQIVHPAGKPIRRGDAVDLFRRMLAVASRGRVTDIHVEPREGGFQVRMRVDGTMVDVVRMPLAMGIRVQALVKVLGEIDLADRNSVQEGHFSSAVPSDRIGVSRRIDYRVSFAPSVLGQKLVMRILDATYAPMHVRALALPSWMQDEIERALRKDAGMLLVCGPTGSGKTTTLYALVRGSNVQRRNVVTIEDPVEIQLESVTQIPVDDEHGKGFAGLLRSVLRQDPDVIMIGEIRDAETARIAMQSAVTGHLVFSTIHTRDAAGAIFRLLDLGVEPYLVAQALHLVLAQRLVRQLCPHCKRAYAPTRAQLDAMGEAGTGVTRLFRAVGCPKCLGTGYRGRRAFFELLAANDALRDVIVKQPTLQSIHSALISNRFQPLQQSGYHLVAEGAVAFSEIERIIGQLQD
ncbi:MAG TPA: ATPase, T2SS/T4P/T4SS family [Tepidisphaeraceae bacterium]|nr:ATPase, T2SS/T4P/T4SS family [Tepidisphaeraceae bacterium]